MGDYEYIMGSDCELVGWHRAVSIVEDFVYNVLFAELDPDMAGEAEVNVAFGTFQLITPKNFKITVNCRNVVLWVSRKNVSDVWLPGAGQIAGFEMNEEFVEDLWTNLAAEIHRALASCERMLDMVQPENDEARKDFADLSSQVLDGLEYFEVTFPLYR